MAYLQWKGTDACIDIACLNCGNDGHFDRDFLYEWTCGRCGQLHEMSSFVRYRAIGPGEGRMTDPAVLEDDATEVDLPNPTWPTAEQMLNEDGAALIVQAGGRTWVHHPGGESDRAGDHTPGV